ncbi:MULTISPECIES: GH12 family glycosyl hydrolase domain-containing protein [Streptomyces]|uniref:GH12 family glycosyl hydrolase domain-containing protein n=1 Tax=Streptomyces TaxID=1883 RepID=UPI0029300DDD|nr:hypothetical protein [Streptomyces sp. NEAU-HV9]
MCGSSPATTRTTSARAATSATAFDTITLGKCYVNDNLWRRDKGTGTQCVCKYGSVSPGGSTWDICRGDIRWNAHSFVRRTNTTSAALDLDDFTQALVRRNLLSKDKYVSRIESGTEVFQGSGRLDAKSYSVGIG